MIIRDKFVNIRASKKSPGFPYFKGMNGKEKARNDQERARMAKEGQRWLRKGKNGQRKATMINEGQ